MLQPKNAMHCNIASEPSIQMSPKGQAAQITEGKTAEHFAQNQHNDINTAKKGTICDSTGTTG